ncbi:MAG: tetratricopeptide repeat protein [Saprospiraceae bacterium]|nr:tetratricopeptide repeat protein [Saprospiraceae bacterium]
MNLIKPICILLTTLTCIQLYAQVEGQALIDSLLIQLPNQKEDTNKVMLFMKLSGYNATISPDEGIKYGQQGLELATKLNWKKGIAMAYSQLGLNYHSKTDYPNANDNNFKSLKIYEELGDKKFIVAANCNIGRVYSMMADYNKALEYFSKALKMAEEIGHKEFEGNILLNLGYIHKIKGEPTKALENYMIGLKLYEDLQNKTLMAMATGNIGAIYSEQRKYIMALEYKQKALNLATELGDKYGMLINLCGIGTTYLDIVNDTLSNDDAIHKDYRSNSSLSIPKGKTALISSAIDYTLRALTLCKEINDLENMSTCYLKLLSAYQLLGNYKKALECHINYQTIRDSIFSSENEKKIIEQGVQYEYEKKEAVTKAVSEKEIQKQKLMRNGFMGGFAVVLLFAGVFFSQRNKIKVGKKQSDELLLNILPAEVAQELKTKGSADAKQFDDVTVMFTDFKGFTQISEKLSPTELVTEIDTCFKTFDHIMGKYHIEKIKTIGDAYMCAGGLPVSNNTHAEDVIYAALEIQKFMADHLQQRKNEGKEIFEIRIGIHTGPVVAGIVGVKKFAYDIWGDTVNIASRMESSGEVGKVNISGRTFELVKDKFTCLHRGKIQAKNKGEIDMYFVEVETKNV